MKVLCTHAEYKSHRYWKQNTWYYYSNLATAAALNTKLTEIENKILGITNLATKAALNTEATGIENRMADAISLITTPEFNRLTKIRFDARKVAAKLFASRSHVDNVLDIADKKREKIQKFKRLCLSYFIGKSYFDNDGSHNHLIFQLIWNTFTNPGGDKLTKNVHPDKYGYSGYVIGFVACSLFLLQSGEWGKNVAIFSVDYSSSVLVDNRKKDIVVLVKNQQMD